MPGGVRLCVGSSDYPLSALGRLRAVLLAPGYEGREVGEVFSSPLSRAEETAALMGARPVVLAGLEEAGMGEWDGLPFDDIREAWPELFARRGKEPYLLPPGAEPAEAVLARFTNAVEDALECTRGDLVFVTHRTALRLFLSRALGMDAAAAAPDKVAAHCRAVEREALSLVCSLAAAGIWLNEFDVSAAALLHDIARTEPEHARRGAEYLNELGYPRVADIIRQHHGLDDPELIDEAAVVFIADKRVQGTEYVGVEERFAASEAKCVTPEAKAAHAYQLEISRGIERRLAGLGVRQRRGV